MSENFSRRQQVTKKAVHGRGAVVAQNTLAAEVGARTLAQGGNAIDAAVTTAMAIGCVEPWMSGIGGIGYMVVWVAKERRAYVVDYGPIAARGLDLKTYALTGGQAAGDLFGWPPVVEDRNIKGYHSVAVPGQVDGMATALQRFGTWSWPQVMAPAIDLAERGMLCDWYATLMIASGAAQLAEFETSRATYLPNGFPPVVGWDGAPPRIRLGQLARTLKRLSDAGPRDYYEGEIARRIIADLNAGGSPIGRDDLAGYHARVVDPVSFERNGAVIHTVPYLTAGPTMKRAFGLIGERTVGNGPPDADAFVAVAEALHVAYEERLRTMGDAHTPSCTTHFNAVDAEGNMVALTQTLLSLFGSRVMLPQTGILMNNGIMWFDPEPGRPNSLAPGKRPLCNICATVVSRGGEGWFAIGASGGRRIVPAITQLTMMQVDRGLDLETAFHLPRIDVSGTGPIRVSWDLPADIRRAIAARHPIEEVPNVVYPLNFANPSCIRRDPATGTVTGMNEIMSPWAGGAAV
ncbi:gamma-glutamyltransferase [Vineibacter terrae]|uniref:Gamma-glutamyltransferase n=1 Tax=Vineibacter terrae TaxID=2586908 RepID=A0A5C8PCF4_9HYPH|nr:gamma-glutamyltransferase [Vineibacter terrae]TXL71247.1 gamma-glutamyltransferase [Vineibacter terrae]